MPLVDIGWHLCSSLFLNSQSWISKGTTECWSCVLGRISSNVSLMKTAVGSALSNVFPNAIPMTCIPHALNLILEEWPRLFDSFNTTVAPIKSFCCQSTLNFVSQGFMNWGMFKIFEWATSSNRSHTIGVNYFCIALCANSDNSL